MSTIKEFCYSGVRLCSSTPEAGIYETKCSRCGREWEGNNWEDPHTDPRFQPSNHETPTKEEGGE